jgi:DNA replication and repair protein RecF
MRLSRLRVRDLRCLAEAELAFGPSMNLITGGNGAGKTSLLEAVHLLGYGRSFRGRVRDGLIRSGALALEVYAEWQDGTGPGHRAGLRHAGAQWTARLDGETAPQLGELCARFPAVTFEPGSHELIAGKSELRRRFLDWALFHVEPEFLAVWRRFSRALKQRNHLLKSRPAASMLDAWDQELAESGERLTLQRERYLVRLEPVLAEVAGGFLSELGQANLQFQPGWRREDLSLADALLLQRDRDLEQGFTGIGPQRADWRIDYAGLPGREALSRGQEKLTALACVLAQARAFAEDRGQWPLVCLDDLASELDRAHQDRVLGALQAAAAQVLLTATEPPVALLARFPDPVRFHVEQGRVSLLTPGATAGADAGYNSGTH